jgi:hemerythrin-like domain-containing protein
MSVAIDDLRHEHDAILFALGILERMVAMAGSGALPDAGDSLSLLAIFEIFVGRCHQGKEEGMLFPALEAAGVSRDGGPIGQMLRDHEECRGCLARMTRSIPSAEGLEAFALEARGFVSGQRLHILKENEILFPMAERVLGFSALDGIGRGFEEFEDKYIDARRHLAVLSSLAGLERKYLSAV